MTKLKLNEVGADRPTLSTTSNSTSRTNLLNNSRYTNLLNVSSSYNSRSNSIVNLNGNSSIYAKPPSNMDYDQPEYNSGTMAPNKLRHEKDLPMHEQGFPSTRRDSNGKLTFFALLSVHHCFFTY